MDLTKFKCAFIYYTMMEIVIFVSIKIISDQTVEEVKKKKIMKENPIHLQMFNWLVKCLLNSCWYTLYMFVKQLLIYSEMLWQVSKAYSKTWSYREDALTSVYRQMQEMPMGNKEEAKSILRAAIFLVKRGIDDKVYAVWVFFCHNAC